jgi:hypothetical protein
MIPLRSCSLETHMAVTYYHTGIPPTWQLLASFQHLMFWSPQILPRHHWQYNLTTLWFNWHIVFGWGWNFFHFVRTNHVTKKWKTSPLPVGNLSQWSCSMKTGPVPACDLYTQTYIGPGIIPLLYTLSPHAKLAFLCFFSSIQTEQFLVLLPRNDHVWVHWNTF